MSRSSSYLLALFSGLILGWIAQQFWFAGIDRQALNSEHNLLRNEQRLERLQEQRRRDREQQAIEVVAEQQVEAQVSENLSVLSDRIFDGEPLQKEDFKAAFSLADKALSQRDIQGAILYLYDLKPQVAHQYEVEFSEKLHDFVLRFEKKYEELGLITDLLDVFQQLINLEPDYVPYYLSLAHWQILSGDLDEAEQSLGLARFDLNYENDIALLEGMINDLRERAKSYIVPLTLSGKHYLTEVLVDDEFTLSLMLDTGATMTIIKSDFVQDKLAELLSDAEVLSLNTANGVVNGSKVIVQSFSLANLSISNVPLGVLPLGEFSYDGLLGMDILGQYEFRIDQEAQELILKPK